MKGSIPFIKNTFSVILLSPIKHMLFLDSKFNVINYEFNLKKILIIMETYLAYFFIGGIICVLLFIVFYYSIKKILEKWQRKYVPTRATKFKCMDGHVTRSKGEMIIDNALTYFNIKHEYEKEITIHGSPVKYDWFLSEYDVYMEYWGYFGKQYFNRKKEKLLLYKKGKLNLISIEDIMLENIYENLKNLLKKYMTSEKWEEKNFYCPNCGTRLDNRLKC